MPVQIHGKDYKTVAERIAEFREKHVDFQIITEIVSNTNYIVIKASILDREDKVIATGIAEEERGSTNINKTSAVENAETSAVGRALAFFGIAGTEIASADEVANAIAQQTEKELYSRFATTMQTTLNCYESVKAIKDAIAANEPHKVIEAFAELTEDEKKALWVAPSKGGPFTTAERNYFQSPEFVEARNEANGLTE